MPKLKSGREFVLALSPFMSRLEDGSEELFFEAAIYFLVNVREPRDFLSLASIGYFDKDGSGPPDGEVYPSGFMVLDLAMGRTDWSDNEIEEFNQWATGNQALENWLEEYFAETDAVIQNSPLWTTERGRQILGRGEDD